MTVWPFWRNPPIKFHRLSKNLTPWLFLLTEWPQPSLEGRESVFLLLWPLLRFRCKVVNQCSHRRLWDVSINYWMTAQHLILSIFIEKCWVCHFDDWCHNKWDNQQTWTFVQILPRALRLCMYTILPALVHTKVIKKSILNTSWS